MEWLHTFVNEVNAHFVQLELEKQGLPTEFRTVKEGKRTTFQLWVSTRDFADAKLAIVEMNLDETLPSPESEGELKRTVDWMQHMYNPGNFIRQPLPGARMNPKAQLALGALVLLIAATGWFMAPPLPWPWRFWAFEIGLAAIGIFLLWNVRKSRSSSADEPTSVS